MAIDFFEIEKGFNSVLDKTAQSYPNNYPTVQGEEALRMIDRIRGLPPEQLNNLRSIAMKHPMSVAMLQELIYKGDPKFQAALQSLAARQSPANSAPAATPAQQIPQAAQAQIPPSTPSMAQGLPAATPAQQIPQQQLGGGMRGDFDANPQMLNPRRPDALVKNRGLLGRAGEFMSDTLGGWKDKFWIAQRHKSMSIDAEKVRNREIEIARRSGNSLGIAEANKKYKETINQLDLKAEEAFQALPDLRERQKQVDNLNKLNELQGKPVAPVKTYASTEHNPLVPESVKAYATSQPKSGPGVVPFSGGAVTPAPAPAAQPAMAPNLPPATNSAPATTPAPNAGAPEKPGFWDRTWEGFKNLKYKIPVAGPILADIDSSRNFRDGVFNWLLGKKPEGGPLGMLRFSEQFKKAPGETLGNAFKNIYNNNPNLVAGGGLLLGGLALNSLFGKKQERQYGPAQALGPSININVGGQGGTPGLLGYHRAGVSTLGSPTGLTSIYGMDNKFGMDMLKHAGIVSTTLGNVVRNRLANQAIDQLASTANNKKNPEHTDDPAIQLAIKNPEVLKLLDDEQNKAYLNRILAEK